MTLEDCAPVSYCGSLQQNDTFILGTGGYRICWEQDHFSERRMFTFILTAAKAAEREGCCFVFN